MQEGVPEADIPARLAAGVEALRPVLAALMERGFSPAAPLLSADRPTWADLYLLPPLADLAAIPERSILDGALDLTGDVQTSVHRALGHMDLLLMQRQLLAVCPSSWRCL